MKIRLLVYLPLLVLVGVFGLTGCSKPEPRPFPPPTPAPAPASAPVSEPAIPAHFTTYTDEAEYFSISYPPDWEVNWSLIDDVKFQEYMESRYSNIDIEPTFSATLFLAGIPTGKGGYSPNIVVSVIPTPRDGLRLENIVDEMIRGEKAAFEEHQVLLRVGTAIEGREAIIRKTELYQSKKGSQQLQMITLADKNIWVVTCTSSPADFPKYEDDFYHILHSIRFLR